MIEKLQTLWPEIVLLLGATVAMIIGVSPSLQIRKLCVPVVGAALAIAGAIAWLHGPGLPSTQMTLPNLAAYGKVITAIVGILLLLVVAGLPDREYEAQVARGTSFDPLRNTRGEFYAFFLFSLTGLMLCAGADDLIWLFLALELTSLPTYIMVAMSTSKNRSMEAGVKYFFLGALGAATFLYGFAMLYGATGTTYLPEMAKVLTAQASAGTLSGIASVGLVMSVLGICFKIAAVPMHFYTADVYQGAYAGVTAFLAFVPKAAGFFALLLILGTVGWTSGDATTSGLPQPIYTILWIIAALTMFAGNILALLQPSLKRIFAYSSIAHTGYMLVGVIAGPGIDGTDAAGSQSSGIGAVLFYLLAYGITNVAAFAVLAALEKRAKDGSSEEVDTFADIKGLCATSPTLGWTLVIACVGLLGLPPLLGFFTKLPLITSGVRAGEYGLVVVLVLNSAIAATYYLRIAGSALLDSPDMASAGSVRSAGATARPIAGLIAAALVIVLAFYPISSAIGWASKYSPTKLNSAVSPAATPSRNAAPAKAEHSMNSDAGQAEKAG